MLRPMALVGCLALLAGCSTTSYDSDSEVSGRGYRAEGTASYYGKAHHGKRTASGERFNQNALTAAHRTLAFGTRVKVTNLDNGRSVVVRINDRGPFGRGRIIDVSKAAAEQLNMLRSGTARVRLEGL
ncbi:MULTISPECIES: septal ring lytic transglycosylase RlpA family protein [Pseudomonas]|uniref:Endolytic peptidoglycan transglycosylase RlpA n=2 Tax=Pseudomonas nitroreducens/multiresinivorans group TaxID=627141 RepID=A0A6G6IRW1_PSENT|nr:MULTISPECIES: septal ring lytic transglycosylase RlpA family protein [Pseudomonas]MBG6286758.1 septal ring lytic transglycosylase RlpA family protein [Pseudomonas nitroreducens]MCE4071713.1 septal ring lytic transglycosylase RlpA family protein [Pseudomonas nitritireducens]MCE4081489.1 septal ring lytic transglycosylase RlpA family protein [Pseudomonas nitroreducens]MCJ1882247.1 septal ring lytic transglycosylase RlpA family protein [Pseudomonas nitroreducens]MCJ1893328.1 septal ring lytic 